MSTFHTLSCFFSLVHSFPFIFDIYFITSMKFNQLAGLLALALSASPVAASVCKPSKASSSSAAPSPSPSAPSGPVCINPNVVNNGDFSNGLTGWSYQDNVSQTTSCGKYPTCLDLNFSAGTNVVSQTLTLTYGATYDFNFLYEIIAFDSEIDTIDTKIIEEDGGAVLHDWSLYTATRSTWIPYSNTFYATSNSIILTISVAGNYGVHVDFTDIVVQKACAIVT